MWVASVEEVAIEILEPSFDVAVKGAQTVDSSNHPCDQGAEAARRVARVWEYVSYVQFFEENSLFECDCKVHKLYLTAQSGKCPLESTIVDGDFKGLENFLV